MPETYHELDNVVETEAHEIAITRTKALLDAVQRHRDYSLLQILRYPAEGRPKLEYLIIEVECDAVPPRNPVGIQYRERLALRVPSNDKELIEVLAMRQDFPVLMHQNQVNPGAPASLCLYFEPAAAVRRTWTPQSFLRRIQWWMEKSARDEIHPADQPVEHLFFASKFELVLPWNFDELRNNPDQRFVVFLQQERPDKGFTCFLEPFTENHPKSKTVRHIELTLPAIVHGFVERDPVTLRQLSDLLAQRKVDLMGPLRTALQEGVGKLGVATSTTEAGTVILLHIPISRSTDAAPDSLMHRAFLIPTCSFQLGVACGALFVHANLYYRHLQASFSPEPSTTWCGQSIFPMKVLKENDNVAARRQSGITEEGPAAVLVGAGSLGSALLNLWGRSGWGRWTVIDKDHIKPHNLSRHAAYSHQIGQSKANVVASLHQAVMRGATEITPIVADACNFTQESVAQALASSALVIDASTTLEYPRAVSMEDTSPRHFSTFITPNGNAAVLLAEDVNRSYRLRTLEAQYYRAMIQNDWGDEHLQGHADTFWSGASCRDISLVMPYSLILGQASTLAEQIQLAAASESSLIRVWQRHPQSGNVDVHDAPVAPERKIELGELDLYIDDGVEQELRALRQQELPNETGGVLLGYYDFNIKAVIVVAGVPAPPDSKAGQAFFERGTAGLSETIRDASARSAGMVGYIGEWHSHPPRAFCCAEQR